MIESAGYIFASQVLSDIYQSFKTKTISNINIKIEVRWNNNLLFEIKQAKNAKDYLERQIFHHYWKANDKIRSTSFSYENADIC